MPIEEVQTLQRVSRTFGGDRRYMIHHSVIIFRIHA